MEFSNPRLTFETNDWPIGGNHRGSCKFSFEYKAGKGYRIVKQTTDKNGKWCKPKTTTYGGAAVIVDGDDGKTYILQDGMMHVTVWRSDLKQASNCFMSNEPERCNKLAGMIYSLNEKGIMG